MLWNQAKGKGTKQDPELLLEIVVLIQALSPLLCRLGELQRSFTSGASRMGAEGTKRKYISL